MKVRTVFPLALLFVCAAACSTTSLPPIETVRHVDLKRFMGDWYVVANIPTSVEKGAHNAVESYELAPNGTIKTTFTFRKDSFDGERKEYHPTGFVKDRESNAVWGMQFIWPIKADYRIIYLTDDYSQTVIGRNKRDYVWVMAHTPAIPDEDFQRMVALLDKQGYDTTKLQRVPQRWE
jgi:apolipoprotein D and lipocalin family protein